MNAIHRTAIAVAIAAVLSGCVVAIGADEFEHGSSEWSEIERANRNAIESLRLGMRIGDVRDAMPNVADFSEAFALDGTDYRILFFRTRRVDADGETTRDETTPVVFADGELVGWGSSVWHDLRARVVDAAD